MKYRNTLFILLVDPHLDGVFIIFGLRTVEDFVSQPLSHLDVREQVIHFVSVSL